MFIHYIHKKNLHTPQALFKVSAGFTLIETLVSMFIFVLVIASVSQIFTSAFLGYRYEKSVQIDLESAQFAMNTMAKELRTASIVGTPTTSSIKFIDYSQGTCFDYEIVAATKTLTVASQGGVTKPGECGSYGSPTIIANGVTGGNFLATKSDKAGLPPVVGKVTISLRIGTGLTHKADIQTSVSLRDYANSGL